MLLLMIEENKNFLELLLLNYLVMANMNYLWWRLNYLLLLFINIFILIFSNYIYLKCLHFRFVNRNFHENINLT